MAANKTPFEVRLDILKMAQEMLEREQANEHGKFYAKLETLRASTADPKTINDFIDANTPKMYEPNDVVARSSALYAFVNDTTRTKP